MIFSTRIHTMAQYATLEEAFGGSWGVGKKFPKEQSIHSSQKVYNSPTRRTEAALETHKDLIADTLKSLPIGDSSESDKQYGTVSSTGSKPHTNTNQIEPFTVNDYTSPPIPGTPDFAYASTPPSMGQSLHFDAKLDKVMRMIETHGSETPSTHDLLLYIFTGVFALFVLDTFVQLGKFKR
jgi:hypothetical protein